MSSKSHSLIDIYNYSILLVEQTHTLEQIIKLKVGYCHGIYSALFLKEDSCLTNMDTTVQVVFSFSLR